MLGNARQGISYLTSKEIYILLGNFSRNTNLFSGGDIVPLIDEWSVFGSVNSQGFRGQCTGDSNEKTEEEMTNVKIPMTKDH